MLIKFLVEMSLRPASDDFKKVNDLAMTKAMSKLKKINKYIYLVNNIKECLCLKRYFFQIIHRKNCQQNHQLLLTNLEIN